MNSIIKIVPNVKKYKTYIEDVKSGITPIMVSGLTDAGKIHLAYSTHFYGEKPVCIVTYNEIQAKNLIKDLEYFNVQIRIQGRHIFSHYKKHNTSTQELAISPENNSI